MKNEIIKKQIKNYHFYDSLGNFKYMNIFKNLVVVNLILFGIWFIQSGLNFTFEQIKSLEFLTIGLKVYSNEFQYTVSNITLQLIINSKIDLYYYSVLAPVVFTVIYLFISLIMFQKSIFQKRLAKFGLESYEVSYLYSLITKSLVIHPKKNEEMDINFIRSHLEEFIQVWGYDINKDIKVEPYKRDKVKITQLKDLPNLINFDISKFQKDYFYLGQYVNDKKLEDLYIPLKSILHTAILGGSGNGKSIFLKLFLSNIFYHFDKLDKLYFIDFKNGIASKPFENVANRLNIQDKIITCDRDINKLHLLLTDISNINENRMKYLKDNDLEKWENEYIFIIFDEFAEVLNYEASTKEDKEILKQIISMINSLFATARSSNIFITYATQSFVKDVSNINTTIKTNTSTKFLFKTTQSTSISSVVSSEDLDDIGVNPKNLKIGEALLLDNESMASLKFKSVFIDKNTDDIIIDVIKQSQHPKKQKVFFTFLEKLKFIFIVLCLSVLSFWFILLFIQPPTKNEICDKDSKYYKLIKDTQYQKSYCKDRDEKN